MPGAPDRSTRRNSLRCGESCEYAAADKTIAAADKIAIDASRILFPFRPNSEVTSAGLRHLFIRLVEVVRIVFGTGLLLQWAKTDPAIPLHRIPRRCKGARVLNMHINLHVFSVIHHVETLGHMQPIRVRSTEFVHICARC